MPRAMLRVNEQAKKLLETLPEAPSGAAAAGVPKDTPKPPAAAEKPAQQATGAALESIFFDGTWSRKGTAEEPSNQPTGADLMYWMTVAAMAEALNDSEEAGRIAADNPSRAAGAGRAGA
jgi:hypothetical protein